MISLLVLEKEDMRDSDDCGGSFLLGELTRGYLNFNQARCRRRRRRRRSGWSLLNFQMRDNSKTHREKQRHREARPANDVLPNGCGRTSFEFEKTSFRAENQSVEGGRKCDRSCGETPKSQQSKVCMTVAAILSDDGPKSAKSYLRKKKKHRKQYDALRTDTIGGFDSFFFFFAHFLFETGK